MHYHTYHGTGRKRNRRNRVCAAFLVLAMAGALTAGAIQVPSVYAKTEAEKKRDEYKDKLKDTNENIENLEGSQADVKDDIREAASEMKLLLGKQEKVKGDIEDKQDEVEQANKELVKAKKKEKEQYEAMKLRIQYMYENSTDNSLWTAIVESDGLADMLNRIEYASDLYQSDRDLMDSYEAAVQQVEDWTVQLAKEMEGLLALQEQYASQQEELNALMAKLEEKEEAYAQQIAEAKEQAEEYQQTISEQEAIIRAQEAAAAAQNPDNYEGGGSGSGGLGGDSYLQDPNCNPSNVTNVSGAEIVAYAQQFVGNPYVWGGNSLTNGCDCSGFVHLVYQHFGISTPRYSQSFKTVGRPVAYQNIQAGDVVVYPGHVAIYIGNGCIVEAQSTRAGITNTRPVNCHTITAIRRLV